MSEATDVAEKKRWTEAEVTILEQEVIKANTKKEGFEAASKLLGRELTAVQKKYSNLHPSKSKDKKTKRKYTKSVVQPLKHLSAGQKIMEAVLGSEIAITSSTVITLTIEGMTIKF